ncbi:uncharacterized protein TRIADDRAFT_25566 [Trichoplax adhaerens]|uniref:Cysteine and histidine-rich domain-containing protein 1 n=1 Tax=Trichoplax adhaerens TaxID=10228 RepID=B3RY23_TRIAD|nr:hypothetical protein TRIADDRAFT_25566 [Trichoplax adhaerens]EDV24959.1 hypothetical protein TRIADDRAFT_25566 [Trichoplax adhaerens]|eukprot:XP_002112849.1 hypothetical protein TRIADDRAFT_25566 [Trichoplax adhaerens]
MIDESEYGLLQCHNKGCGKKYRESDNSDDACIFHPGKPVFHDAYKSWSCCKQRSTDFTVFLNYPGCTRSHHCNIKPQAEKLEVTTKLQPGEVIEVNNQPKKIQERPRQDEPTMQLKAIVAPSLKSALDKKQTVSEKEADPSADKISEGTPCQNRGCKCSFSTQKDIQKECVHHPGYPIFHEGMKYWSCCNKKTSDFTEFLNQKGCATGQHCWKHDKVLYDWYQTGSNVYITIYAKLVNPERSLIEANHTIVKAFLIYGDDEKQYNKSITLEGVILPEKSLVQYLGTKIEIKLKKFDTNSWNKLEL